MNSNILASYKYQLSDTKRSIIIYYCVILALLILMSVSMVTVTSSSNVTLSGMDFATVVFLFVIGLVSFKEPFKMLIQNGVSRKSMFISKILTALTITLIMSVADKIIMIVCRTFASHMDGTIYNSMFEQVYNAFLHGKPGILIHADIFIYNFVLYLMMFALGTLITLVFYRMNKAGKIALGVGIPVFFSFIFPIIDTLLLHNKLSHAISHFINFALGIYNCNPYAAMITFTISSILFFALSWLLIRRAVIK